VPYNDLNGIRARMNEISPTLTKYDAMEPANFVNANQELGSSAKLSAEPLRADQVELSEFYMTNSIARASSTMAKCVKSFEHNKNKAAKQSAAAAN